MYLRESSNATRQARIKGTGCPKIPEIKVDFARYKALADSGNKIRLTEQTYYRRKKKFAGLRVDQAKRREAIDQVRV